MFMCKLKGSGRVVGSLEKNCDGGKLCGSKSSEYLIIQLLTEWVRGLGFLNFEVSTYLVNICKWY